MISLLFVNFCLFSQNNKLYISNLYATSTNLPLEVNSVFNCFDSCYNTSWNTIKGSCQEEGIMIKLNKPSFISSIKVFDNNKTEIEDCDIYIDGSGYGKFKIEREITNIFIKASSYCNSEQFSISEVQFLDKESKPYQIYIPEKVNATIFTSSQLAPEEAYGSINLIDGQKENGWAEGVPSSGVGEEIRIKLEKNINITDILFWNGYQRSIKHFESNARTKRILIKNANTGYEEEHVLNDEFKPQKIAFKKAFNTNELVIQILEVYKGSKYKDLVISEIQLLDNNRYYSLNSEKLTERIASNLFKANNNLLLKKILDKNISFSNNDQVKEGQFIKYIDQTRSILLRSNNTFVWYQNEVENIVDTEDEEDEMGEEISKQIIADGSWYIVEETNDNLKIKIFGKMFEPRDSSDIYKGNVTNKTLKIFHDYLTISKTAIKGENIFETIPLNY